MGYQDKVNVFELQVKIGPSSTDYRKEEFRIEVEGYDLVTFKRQTVGTSEAYADTFGCSAIFGVLVANISAANLVVKWTDADSNNERQSTPAVGSVVFLPNVKPGTAVAGTLKLYTTSLTGDVEVLVIGKRS